MKIIDTLGLIYKAYYALINNKLITSYGFPTYCIFGFFQTLFKFIEGDKDKFILVFESTTPTFRKDLYQPYKANRPPVPDELKAQINYLIEIINNSNIPMIYKDGYEADDVIGSIAKKIANNENVYILTSDKDLLQLVDKNISILKPQKNITDIKKIGVEEVYQEIGVYPNQIPDYLGLIGDSSDNIPGVKGIGPKTAVALLQEYKTIENIYENIDKIDKNISKKLIEDRENAFLSKKLATIITDLEIDIENYTSNDIDTEKLLDYFKKLEFKKFTREFVENAFGIQSKKVLSIIEPSRYHLINTIEELKILKNKILEKKFCCIDTETTTLNILEAKMIGISFSVEEKEAYYISFTGEKSIKKDDFIREFKEIIESEEIKKIGQNIKYDYHVLRNDGLILKGIYFDTMIAAHLLEPDERTYNMDILAEKYLNYKTIKYNDIVEKDKTLLSLDVGKVKDYSCEDADITLRLYNIFKNKIKEENLEYIFYNIEMKLLPILAEMEQTGIKIDKNIINNLEKEIVKEIRDITEKIYSEAGTQFNINSPKQLSEILYKKLNISTKGIKKRTTGFATDERNLKKLKENKIVSLILEYRSLNKYLNTYLIPLSDYLIKDKIHTNFSQVGTATGRLSSSSPNLQNIPIKDPIGRKIRNSFIAENSNLLISADYSQIELRLMAAFSKDKILTESFNKDIDIHKVTASLIFNMDYKDIAEEQRRIAKTINFGIIYGMGQYKLADELEITPAEAKVFIDSYFNIFKGVKEYIETVKEEALRKGYVETIFGRKRFLNKIKDIRKDEMERIAVNTIIQGSNADIIKIGMIKINDILQEYDAKMVLQIHDELLFEVKEEKAEELSKIIKEIMENIVKIEIPLKVNIAIGKSWGELK
ncbi:MAG TPA: DNA polymerase I [Spirochaetota bacterium]|nr:DNA polymerase I [Spirochaetota bacterium]HOM38091.1 DNA polymerase I [Spirochaetota bacterium]HPQ48893.1 DNA polymerase I [Spirochaetota bacterium]